MLAKNLSVAVVCASQLNRSCETEDRDARLSDLRDSGSLEQDARQVCLIGRGEQQDEFILHVAKNNYGPAGQKIKMVRLDSVRRFEERDEQFSKR
jgi:replicative DNA helicase